LAFAIAAGSPLVALAQSEPPFQGDTVQVPELTMGNVIGQAARAVGAAGSGDALGMASKLAIGTAPVVVPSSGFQIKLDPSTGLQVRTATTFGPAFAERALTSGEGTVTAAVNLMSSSYKRLDAGEFDGVQLRRVTGAVGSQRTATSNLTLTANTILIAARIGVTDKLDVGGAVPLMNVKVGGSTTLVDGTGSYLAYASASGVNDGVGDVSGLVKYRILSFGEGQPDPGGLAVMVSMRLPTGSEENLRGMGITRTQGTFIASSGTGRFKPHANVGFEYWDQAVSVISEATGRKVEARHQLQYAGGFELEAAPKATVLVDIVGGQIYGGGKLGAAAIAGAANTEGLVALDEGLSRIAVAPGVKVNLKGKMVLTVNALVTLKDSGLHSRVTTVAGLDVTF
jgi:hypothetical protein